MTKKVVKLAIIRKDNIRGCPFGLGITSGCKNAGELIKNMAPLDMAKDNEEKEEIKEANKRLFSWQAPCQRCAFAGKLIDEKRAVECNYNSNAPGISSDVPLVASPFYSKVYNNIALDGLYSTPIGYFGDNNISRNLYFGIYSLMGNYNKDELEKKTEEVIEEFVKEAAEIKK